METVKLKSLSREDLREEIVELCGEHYTLTMRQKWVEIKLRELREQLHLLNQGE